MRRIVGGLTVVNSSTSGWLCADAPEGLEHLVARRDDQLELEAGEALGERAEIRVEVGGGDPQATVVEGERHDALALGEVQRQVEEEAMVRGELTQAQEAAPAPKGQRQRERMSVDEVEVEEDVLGPLAGAAGQDVEQRQQPELP